MSDFKAKMRQIRFPLGLRLGPRWRSLQRSPRSSLAVFEGSTFKWIERGRREEINEKGMVKGRKVEMRWMEEFGPHKNFGVAPSMPVAGFKGAASRRRGGEKEGRGTEREKSGRKEEKGSGGKLEQGRQLAKAGPGTLYIKTQVS